MRMWGRYCNAALTALRPALRPNRANGLLMNCCVRAVRWYTGVRVPHVCYRMCVCTEATGYVLALLLRPIPLSHCFEPNTCFSGMSQACVANYCWRLYQW